MPLVKSDFCNDHGAIIDIRIADQFGFRHAGQVKTVPALIDTGSSITCVSPNTIVEAHLTARGKRPSRSVHGCKEADLFLADIGLPTGDDFEAMFVMGLGYEPEGFSVLLGRDLLRTTLLTLDGPNGKLQLET